MQNQSLVRTGKTVDEAIELAALELGVGRDEVEVDVISKGRTGILGIGAEPAKVRVSLITRADGSASAGLGVARELLKLMGVNARPTIRSSGSPDEPAVIDIQGDDAGLVIGHRGETLRALQFIARLILSQQKDKPVDIVIDVEQYRERRTRQIQSMAQRTAKQVVSTGRPAELEPMSPADRRIVHMTLANYRGVSTQSSGEGAERHVVIHPMNGGETRATGDSQGNGPGRRPSRRRGGPRQRLDDDRFA